MTGPLSGPGIGLQLPQNLYPSELTGAPIDSPSNRITLAGGETLPLPAGDWYITLGNYLILQFLDPVTGIWAAGAAAAWTGSIQFIKSDGFNVRIANLTGCPLNASVTAYGSAYVQASTTVAVTGGGGSTWQPIIGGQIGTVSTFSVNIPTVGGGYGVAPILLIPPPPPAANNPNGVGGVPATGYVIISSGTLSSVVLTNPGAGYPVAPTPVVVTNPTDPNISSGITQGAVAFSLTGSGSLTAVLCTNNGAPLANPANITLTVSGVGTNATAVANVLQTITAASVTGGGAGYGTVAALLTTVGGIPNAGTITNNPDFLNLAFRPRAAQVQLSTSGATGTIAATTGLIIDGGLFLSKPTAVIVPGAGPSTGASITGPTVSLTMGSAADIAVVQPAP
jgi:hypothetical protein